MSYLMWKPAWPVSTDGTTVISPASVLLIADWWDAWRLMWIAIGYTLVMSAPFDHS
jgi:hypothetical protein